MRLILEHAPNVDLMHGQGNGTGYWTDGPPCEEHQDVVVSDLAEASNIYQGWIRASGLGSGNLTAESGKVYDGETEVARVSQNGRVWTPHPYYHKEITV